MLLANGLHSIFNTHHQTIIKKNVIKVLFSSDMTYPQMLLWLIHWKMNLILFRLFHYHHHGADKYKSNKAELFILLNE